MKISEELRVLRHAVLHQDPSAFDHSDDAAIGRELNEFRTVLARLHSVHNSAGRVTGWAWLELPPQQSSAPPSAPDGPPVEDTNTGSTSRAKSRRA